jgi:hypothetical protein
LKERRPACGGEADQTRTQHCSEVNRPVREARRAPNSVPELHMVTRNFPAAATIRRIFAGENKT